MLIADAISVGRGSRCLPKSATIEPQQRGYTEDDRKVDGRAIAGRLRKSEVYEVVALEVDKRRGGTLRGLVSK